MGHKSELNRKTLRFEDREFSRDIIGLINVGPRYESMSKFLNLISLNIFNLLRLFGCQDPTTPSAEIFNDASIRGSDQGTFGLISEI